ncbi:DUF6443 domain-containing protein [Pedobacter psychrodurus]|uniref:DUF6443 domain-containing protein n=1 Tax=Pedobacter psychrodurus TaxID=2530456 RepID=UPI00292CDC91|nr:DUF6443 domain-containing protein [Pedobacter psychrodurus]
MKKLILLVQFFLLTGLTGYGQTLVTAPLDQDNMSGDFYSTGSIILAPGFATQPGGAFRAFISNCTPMAAPFTGDQNYIAVYTPRQAFSAATDLRTKNICELMLTVKYFDGLGRPIQVSQVRGSADGTKDLIQPFEYNSVGREVKKFLPYAKALSGTLYPWNTSGGDGVYVFYNPGGSTGSQLPNGVARIPAPFAETRYETSMLERPLEQGAPGDPWQLSQGHTIKTEYSYNAVNEAGQYFPYLNTGTNQFSFNTFQSPWPAGTLIKTVSRDENWQVSDGLIGTTAEFKDFEGHVLLRRAYNRKADGQAEVLNTHYVYDDYGNLIFVLPPAIYGDPQYSDPATIPAGVFIGPNAQQLDNICYQYRYDSKNRLIEKKLPGKGWEYLVYDKLNRVVMAQDANQRNHSNQEWYVTKYDKFGRTVASGIFIDAGSTANTSRRLLMQSNVDAVPSGPPWEIRTSNAGNGYMNSSGTYNTYPVVLGNTQVVNYYDDYTFPGALAFVPQNTAGTMTKGLLTGTRTYTTSGSASYLSVNFYDDDGHLKETLKDNSVGGKDRVVNTFDFTNAVTSTTRTHTKGSQTTTIAVNYGYDHMGRKIQTTESINGAAPIILSKLAYNEIGQLRTKQLHSSNEGQSFINTASYLYNERGWLNSINDPDAVSPSTVFAERVQYAEGSLPQYNGNIAQLSWQTVVPAGLSLFQGVQSFSYEYDKVNRLRKAVYTTPGNLNRFNEELSYDLRGNILTLNRTNSTAANTFLNKFVYTYSSGTNTGNKLLSLEDTGTANQDGSYQYDDNGNVSVDSRNLVTGISYNYLNLPNTVTRSTGSINYTYIAGGNKVKKVSGAMTRDYIDGIEYSNGSLEFIPTEEGRAVPSGGSFVYEYFLRDHLGNTRAGIKQDGGIIQVQDYYAFGLDMNPGNAYIGSALNNYKYNNKEKQDELGQYDYGARFYDPVIGRWNRIDNKTEAYEAVSPYVYAVNDPVNAIDPDGNLVIFVNGFIPLHWYKQDNDRYIFGGIPNWNYTPYPPSRDLTQGYPYLIYNNKNRPHDYWGNVDNAFMQGYKDNNSMYINASSDNTSDAQDRFTEGIASANNLISQLENGDISLSKGETIKIVGHSQGGAFAAGMASVFSKSKKYASILQEVVYLEPHQPADFNHPSNIKGTQISSSKDRVASVWNFLSPLKGKTSFSRIRGISQFISNGTHDDDSLGGHSVGTNLDEIISYFRGKGVTVNVR